MNVILNPIFLLLTTGCLVYILRSSRVDLTGRVRNFVIVFGVLQVVLLGLTINFFWPFLSPAWSRREVVADEFMSAVAAGETDRAMAMAINSNEADVAELRTNLANPANQPVSWELGEANPRHIVVGTAVFPDGESKEVVIHMTWEWPRARWAITGAEFGDDIGEGNVRSWLHTEFIPLRWLIGWIQAASLISLFGVWRATRVEKRAYWLQTGR